jgi:hypothetical protein
MDHGAPAEPPAAGTVVKDGASQSDERAAAGLGRSPARRRALIALGAIALVVTSAWVIQSEVVGEEAEAPAGASASSYSVAVVQRGRELKRFTVADLQALPNVAVTIDGKEQDGPALPAVLAASGAGSYQTLNVKGIGARDSGHLTLSAAQVNDRVVIDFSDRGTVKICSPDIEWSDWVRDVVEISLD